MASKCNQYNQNLCPLLQCFTVSFKPPNSFGFRHYNNGCVLDNLPNTVVESGKSKISQFLMKALYLGLQVAVPLPYMVKRIVL